MSHSAEYRNPAAFNYAQALLNLARKHAQLEVIAEQARVLLQVVEKEGAQLPRFLRGPQIPTPTKMALIDHALKGQVDELLLNLLKMLVRRDRAQWLADVLRIFHELAAEVQGLRVGRVVSAMALDATEQERLRVALEKFLQQKLQLDFDSDPYLIGGVVFQSGDELIDYSVRGRLENLRKRLSGVKV